MRRHTGIDLVRAELLRAGRIEAFDAVYHLTEPDGTPHRITRLAAVIHTLRHREGMNIETIDEPGKLAVYVLRRPSVSPRRGPVCPVPGCTHDLQDITPSVADNYVWGRCIDHGRRMARRFDAEEATRP